MSGSGSMRCARSCEALCLTSPRLRRAVRGKVIHYVAVHARPDRFTPALSGCRDTERPSMRFRDSIFGDLLKPIRRRQFDTVVERYDGDAYDKSFRSRDHLVVLIYAQLSGLCSLRGVVAGFNSGARHYRLNVDEIARSTLSDANARRPPE